ncbi:lysylphosphatidylglycerol synthase transmembrane domain-containing protein [Spirillospora albida]|uniref:lysylphosphatidylglycerol synthase transmembrane domain-containing protein n=1 Tax=Spirillospora albida TaxID=58123 RepID=UPI0009FECE06|nr:lysylphosphatidylglycerol synthase transmembrane domain-containing protein [Spirillospora albida]
MHDTVTAPVRLQADAPPSPPSGAPAGTAGAPTRWRRARGPLLRWGFLAAVLAALPFFAGSLPDPGAMWASLKTAHPAWLVVVVVAEAGSMGAFARLQRRLLRVGGLRMSRRRAFAITYAGNALSTTLPAGPAVSIGYTFRQFRRGGASARLATAVIVAGGVITTAAYTVIGLLALTTQPQARVPVLVALAVPVLLFLPALRWGALRARLAVPLRHLYRAALAHPRIGPHAARLADVRTALRPSRRDWAALAALAVLNWVCDIVALLAAAHAVGIDVAPHTVALAYFAAQAAGSALPLLPGGLGAIEGSMAAALVAFGSAVTPAVAAVGLYRLISYWAVVAVGWTAWLALHDGPRVPERARAAAVRAGGAVLRSLTAAAPVTPCGGLGFAPPAHVRRP